MAIQSRVNALSGEQELTTGTSMLVRPIAAFTCTVTSDIKVGYVQAFMIVTRVSLASCKTHGNNRKISKYNKHE